MPSEDLQLANVISTFHSNLVMLDDLRQTNTSLIYLRGVVTGVFATLLTVGIGYGLWRLI